MPKKTIFITTVIASLVLLVTIIDILTINKAPLEIGTVAHTSITRPAADARGGEAFTLVVVQPERQRTYYFTVPEPLFAGIQPGDKLPLGKHYGGITGIEYHVFINLTL